VWVSKAELCMECLLKLTATWPAMLASAQFRADLDRFRSRFDTLRNDYKDAMLAQIAVAVSQCMIHLVSPDHFTYLPGRF
jgi:hypothetical protein